MSPEQTSDIPQQTVTYQVTSQALLNPAAAEQEGLWAAGNRLILTVLLPGAQREVSAAAWWVEGRGRRRGGGAVGHLELDMG